MTRKILITGATGFVGSFLLEALDRPDHQIFGTSYPHEPCASDLSCDSEIRRLDIRCHEPLETWVRETGPDWVFHLAAVSNVGHSWDRRQETLETNLLGTLNVLEAVRKHAPRARVLFVSSSNVYADVPESGQSLAESHIVRAISPYAYTKISGEQLCRFYGEIEGLDVVISRAFPHTGPRQSPDFVCSDWARQIARIEKRIQEPELFVGNIDVCRDFLDVRDVVQAYVKLLERGRSGETYNVASGKAVSLRKILERLCSRSSEDVRVHVDPGKLRKTDILHLQGDNRKLREETEWEWTIPLDQTLSDLLAYWRNAQSE